MEGLYPLVWSLTLELHTITTPVLTILISVNKESIKQGVIAKRFHLLVKNLSLLSYTSDKLRLLTVIKYYIILCLSAGTCTLFQALGVVPTI